MLTPARGHADDATGVVTPFFVPVKVTMMLAFVLALPSGPFQARAFRRPAIRPREAPGPCRCWGSTVLFLLGMAFCYSLRVPHGVPFHGNSAPKSITPGAGYRAYLSL